MRQVAARHLHHFGYAVSVCYPKPTPKPLYQARSPRPSRPCCLAQSRFTESRFTRGDLAYKLQEYLAYTKRCKRVLPEAHAQAPLPGACPASLPPVSLYIESLYRESLYKESLYRESLYRESLYRESLDRELLYSRYPCRKQQGYLAHKTRCERVLNEAHAPAALPGTFRVPSNLSREHACCAPPCLWQES